MLNDTQTAGKRLGNLLVRRRIELNPAWRIRTTFADEHNLLIRIITDLENGKRFNFERGTIASLEVAYRLAPGSLRRSLASGVLEAAAESRRPGQFQVISDPDGSVAVQQREAADKWAKMVTTPVGEELKELKAAIEAAWPGASGREIFPEQPKIAEVWDMQATPWPYRMFSMAILLRQQRHPEGLSANKAG